MRQIIQQIHPAFCFLDNHSTGGHGIILSSVFSIPVEFGYKINPIFHKINQFHSRSMLKRTKGRWYMARLLYKEKVKFHESRTCYKDKKKGNNKDSQNYWLGSHIFSIRKTLPTLGFLSFFIKANTKLE